MGSRAVDSKWFREWRLLVAMGFFALLFAVLFYRGYQLHLAGDSKVNRLARRQHVKMDQPIPTRGHIYDRHGNELAISVPAFSLAAHPYLIKDPVSVVETLAPILNLDVEPLLKKIGSEKKFSWIKRRLSASETKQLLEILKGSSGDKSSLFKGIVLAPSSRRFYPHLALAGQILGAVDYDGEGLGGLESLYNGFLRGDASGRMVYRDARGRAFDIDGNQIEKGPSIGSLELTLDKMIQYLTETELEKICRERQAKKCNAVVVDPHTGEILAMASYPLFNPNAYSSYEPSYWRNSAITDSFEPGSIFKVITAAAALDTGKVKPADTFYCEKGEMTIDDRNVIHDHENYGALSFSEIVKVSSNIGIYKVSHKIGKEAFYEYIRDFGFGSKIGVDFPGEGEGLIRLPKQWSAIDFANIAFGHGVSVTPLQVAMAYAAIANGGKLMQPYFVRRKLDGKGEPLWEMKPKVIRRVISEATARELTAMLVGVTEAGGTAPLAAVPGYAVAGKTGTAQKMDWELRQYSHQKFIASFVGYLPASHPQVVITISVDEPQEIYYGGLVAGPLFRNIAEGIVRYRKIPPEFEAPQLAQAGVVPLVATEDLPDPKIFLKRAVRSALPQHMIPHFSGMGMREVLESVPNDGVHWRFVGSGVAVSQEPPPGAPLKSGMTIRVNFQPRLITERPSVGNKG